MSVFSDIFSGGKTQIASQIKTVREILSRPWVVDLLAPLKGRMTELVFISFIVNLIALVVPVFVLQVYDRVVGQGGLTTLQALVIGVLIAIGFDFLLRQARSRFVQANAVSLDAALARGLFDKLTRLPLRALEKRSNAEWQTSYRDTQTLRDFFAGPPLILMIELPFILIFIGFAFLIAPAVAWLLLILIPVYVAISVWATRSVGAATTQEQHASIERDRIVGETIRGRDTIKALHLGPRLQQSWEDYQAVYINHAVGRGTRNDSFSHLGMTLTMTTTVIMTCVGALAILDQQMTIGALIALNMVSGRIIQPMNQLIGIWRVFVRAQDAFDRLDGLFSSTEDRHVQTIDKPRPKGIIELRDATFSYDMDAAPAAEGISLAARPGQIIGIVGANGSGKTTILKMLQGLYYPQSGSVHLDDAVLSQYSREQIARWVGYVPQEPFLFAGTIRDNIAAGDPALDDQAILSACQAIGADDFIRALPDGYGTRLGESGAGLTPGQRQSIAIARAIAGDPPVLLLDEPSASLDLNAEGNLRRAIRMLSTDHTILLVTHSKAMLEICTHIAVVQDGKLAQTGPAKPILTQMGLGPARPAARPVPMRPPGAASPPPQSPPPSQNAPGDDQ